MPFVPNSEMTLGPFFPREFGQGADDLTVLDGKPVRGQIIEITGCVTQSDGKPLDNVILEIWQANSEGRFDDPAFLGWGRAATDRQGSYRFRTIRPGAPEGRAAHINFMVMFSGLMRILNTTLFFDDGADPVLSTVLASRRELLVARKKSRNTYEFNIRLRGENETPFFDD